MNVYDFCWNHELQKNEEILLDELDILHYIRENIEIEEGFTLRHYFEFIKKWEILQIFDEMMAWNLPVVNSNNEFIGFIKIIAKLTSIIPIKLLLFLSSILKI